MLRRFINWADQWLEEVLVSIMMALLVILLGSEVFSRFILGRSFPWMEELCHYLFIWGSYVGIAVAIKRKEQIRILCLAEVVKKYWPNAAKGMYVVSEICFAIFCLMIVYYSKGMMENMMRFKQVSGALEINMIYPYSIIPLSMILIAFRTLQRVYKDFKNGTLWYTNQED
ncbi:MAG: TRAP transporter small permease [Mailhella sp.]|nr:TRAP transporter small permease [Mailhella sp.]MBQ8744430.1 TRAP transporter small permease [Mailhella sp.]